MVSAGVECRIDALVRSLALSPIGHDAVGVVADYGASDDAGPVLQVRAYAWPAALCRAVLRAGRLILHADGASLWLYIGRDGAVCFVASRPDEFRRYAESAGVLGLDIRGLDSNAAQTDCTGDGTEMQAMG